MKAKKTVESFSCQPASVSQRSHRFWQFEETKSFHSRLKICQNLSDVINRSDRLKLCLCVVAVSIGHGSCVHIQKKYKSFAETWQCRETISAQQWNYLSRETLKLLIMRARKRVEGAEIKINWVFMSLSMSFRFDCADHFPAILSMIYSEEPAIESTAAFGHRWCIQENYQ